MGLEIMGLSKQEISIRELHVEVDKEIRRGKRKPRRKRHGGGLSSKGRGANKTFWRVPLRKSTKKNHDIPHSVGGYIWGYGCREDESIETGEPAWWEVGVRDLLGECGDTGGDVRKDLASDKTTNREGKNICRGGVLHRHACIKRVSHEKVGG